MKFFLEYIKKWVDECPDKPAIIAGNVVIVYRDLYSKMVANEPLPIPLLGDSWGGSFTLHTTGTTGQQKGVIISQETVLSNSENLIAGQGFSHDTVFVIAGDMTHLGCWSKIFPTLMQGGTLLILKDGMKDLDAFFQSFDFPHPSPLTPHPRFATFLVPSNIRILLQFAPDRLAALADRIDFLETGAAPMAHADMLKLCELLPHTRLYNTYASTETGIVATFNYNAHHLKQETRNEEPDSCIAGCAGHPFPNFTVVITPEGHIACNGLDTNDNGFIDEQGRLHVLGRDGDIINVGGYKVNPVEVENVALSFPGIEDCICIAKPHPVLGNALALLLVTVGEPVESINRRDLARFIASKLDRYKVPLTYTVVEKIERTFNGKLNRKYYRQ